jgi:hypothetical protein
MASSSDDDRYVMFQSGLAVPRWWLTCSSGWKASDDVRRNGDLVQVKKGTVVPHDQIPPLTDEDREVIQRWRYHLLALVDYQQSPAGR